MARATRTAICVAACAVALFAAALIGASPRAGGAGVAGGALPTIFSGELTRRDDGARAMLTASELGAGYAPVRARLTLDLFAVGCFRPSAGNVRIVGPSGGGGLLDLVFDAATCERAVGTYRGGEGAWLARDGRATLDAAEGGEVVLGLYP